MAIFLHIYYLSIFTFAGASPAKVKLTLQLRGGCWRTSSRKVAVFTFQEASGHVSSHALLDLEYLFRCSSKPGAGAMQIKICVVLRCGGKRVARADLEEFLGQLTRGGRLDSFFLYIHEEKVALLQANQPITDPGTEWLFEGESRRTHTMVKAATHEENDDTNELEDCTDEHYEEWKAYLEKVFSVEDDGDADEVTSELREASDAGKGADEVTSELREASDAGKGADEVISELREASDAGKGADEVISELREASDAGKGAEEVTSELREASDAGKGADEVTSELREASDAGKGADEVTSELREASDAGKGADEVISELREASDAGKGADEVISELREASDAGKGADEVTSELREASDAGKGADEVISELREASDAGKEAAREATSPDQEVPHPGESSAPETVSATPATASHAYRSLAVPHRFISRLAGPEDRHLDDLRRGYGVQITRIKRTLHVKGHKDSVLKCHNFIRAKIAEWRRCEAAEAH
ncbi:BICD family-like cargo adapter 2 isoform X38 [Eriocheir sinensis]|uniref:BICD family-like cargo adapter 2 isoform X36 n=1 Tax=Eriocheir sinensis TaxID=95602 RepID=UPI0021C9A93F|nr:BICD family-like cargo adapter 2 isoform X36 [Eriocheir sinensis]XP_050696581.1 BICD family-like cargo adapter 2 isoform X37 [Eriocheir sinensis]XP_050696582.1 BICD family-like cargo adapter 2 isoform X38 [Eriocheir sinensis]